MLPFLVLRLAADLLPLVLDHTRLNQRRALFRQQLAARNDDRRLLSHAMILAGMLLPILFAAFFDGAVFGTYVTETGPQHPQSRAFSTNWFVIGAERDLGRRGSILGRARFSLEPLTIPREGYPQLFQYVSPRSGGPLVDAMRAHDLVEEVAVGLEWRPIQLYLAPIGNPPLGAEPYAQRPSSIDFAEGPFTYDVQESFHLATRVASVALTSRIADVEYGVFHASQSTGRHSSINDGKIDSWSARITIAPQSKLSAQISSGRLTETKRKVSSASVSYNGKTFASSAIWTKQDELTAYSFEMEVQLGRGTLLGRTENLRERTHTTVGYIFDVVRTRTQRAGVGLNVDYHSNTRVLQPVYGHKPQSVYMFVRWRTEGITRPASP